MTPEVILSLLFQVAPNYAVVIILTLGGYRVFSMLKQMKDAINRLHNNTLVISKALLKRQILTTDDLKDVVL